MTIPLALLGQLLDYLGPVILKAVKEHQAHSGPASMPTNEEMKAIVIRHAQDSVARYDEWLSQSHSDPDTPPSPPV